MYGVVAFAVMRPRRSRYVRDLTRSLLVAPNTS
jgi:hypothetical protein